MGLTLLVLTMVVVISGYCRYVIPSNNNRCGLAVVPRCDRTGLSTGYELGPLGFSLWEHAATRAAIPQHRESIDG